MQQACIDFKSSQVNYWYHSGGNKLLICFHGYDESAQTFNILEPYLADRYNILSVDLPFHGKTFWREGMNFTLAHLMEIIGLIRHIHFPEEQAIYLMGYSMGGRIVLSVLQHFASNTKEVILMAPDGFQVNFWYWLATQTSLGNRLFSFTMKHPGWFFGFLKTGNALGLVNQSVLKFTRYYIHDREARQQLYDRWTCTRTFKPDLDAIKKLVMQHHISVHLLYGRHDRIIRFERGQSFCKGIEPFCTLEILDSGHQVLQEKNAAAICNLLPL